jgi:DNA topoisomerase-3
LPDTLTSPKLTAEWENMLKQIEKGETTGAAFLSGIAEMIRQLVHDNAKPLPGKETLFAKYAKQSTASKGEVIGVCPRCKADVCEGNNGFFCDNNACGFKLWRDAKFFTAKKKELTKAIATALLKDGKASVTGFYSEKSGKTYDAVVALDDTGKYVNFKLEFEARNNNNKRGK